MHLYYDHTLYGFPLYIFLWPEDDPQWPKHVVVNLIKRTQDSCVLTYPTPSLNPDSCNDVFVCVGYFSIAQRHPLVLGLLAFVASRSHSDTPHSVGLLCTSDQPDAEISDNTQHSQETHPCYRRDSNPQSPQGDENLFCNPGSRWRWVVNSTPPPLYPLVSTVQGTGWASGPAWTGAEIFDLTGFENRAIEPLASSCSDCDNPACIWIYALLNFARFHTYTSTHACNCINKIQNVNKKSNRCNSMQIFIHCQTTLHVSGVTAPIIRSIKNCTRSLRYRSYYLYRYFPPT